MQKFIVRPSIEMYPGIKVNKDTKLEYETESVKQTIENLIFKSITTIKTEEYESKYDTTVFLKEGDILIFEEDGRGYIKPVESIVSVEEAIEDLENIKELCKEG